MGRGDKRTKKGKICRGSFGKIRRPSNRTKKEFIVPLPKEKPAEQPVTTSEEKPAENQAQPESQEKSE